MIQLTSFIGSLLFVTTCIASPIHSCFLEEIKVDPEFDYFTLVYSNKQESEERSDHLSPENFKGFLWDYFYEEELFANYDNRTDSTIYAKIYLDQLIAGVHNRSSDYANYIAFEGRLEFTDFKGNILQSVLLSSDQFSVDQKLLLYDPDIVSWVRPLDNDFAKEITGLLADKVIEYIKTMDVSHEKPLEELPLVPFDEKATPQNVFDIALDSRILGIIVDDKLHSATLLDNKHFVCDYKEIYDQEQLKVLTSTGDTIGAKIVRSNKSWDIALCALEQSVSAPSIKVSEEIAVGNEMFVRGHTGSFELPILCSDGNFMAQIDRDHAKTYLVSAGSSDNFSGAPAFNRQGELLGIVIINGRERGEEIFACIPYNALYKLLNLSKQ